LMKHKKIVKAIVVNIPKEQVFISNADIKTKILPQIKAANFKSFSLIRKVFFAMKAMGIKNFDNNGVLLK